MKMRYTLDQRVERARTLRAGGYNCSQCVVMSFDDIISGDLAMLTKAAHGFGSGIGGSGDVCGAVTGSTMVLGITYDDLPRPELYKRVHEAVDEFVTLEGHLDCRDLKGEGRRPCVDLITDAVTIIHKRLADE